MESNDTKFTVDKLSFESSEMELNFLKTQMRLEEALEKVRSKTMIIQDSNELSDAASILFQQIERFGPKPVASAFIIGNKEEQTGEIYISADGSVIPESFTIPYHGEPAQDQIFKSWLKGEDFTIVDLKGDALVNHLRFIAENMPVMEMLDSGTSPPPTRLALHIIHFKYGFLGINYIEPQTSMVPILSRFAQVFEQTYTRFLDLRKVERQARDAEVEAALERIRTKSMLMKSNNELNEVLATILKELNIIGVDTQMCSIGIFDKETKGVDWWSYIEGKELPGSFHFPYLGNRWAKEIHDAWLERKPYHFIVLEGEEKMAMDKLTFEKTEWKKLPDQLKKAMLKISVQSIKASYISMECGMLEVISEKPLENEKIQLLRRFTRVIDLTYTRVNDLMLAQKQAREAEIEAALEVLRSRTMAMRQSHELSEVVSLMYNKMKTIGLAKWGANIILCHEDKELFEYWLAEERTSDHSKNYFANATEHPVMRKIWRLWKTQGPPLILHHKNEEKKEFDEYWINKTDFKHLPDDVKASVFEQDEVYLNYVSMRYGLLNTSGYKRLSDDLMEILTRFAQVFEQTYTRFLDLQKAEEQAREAQIEAALERVRSKSMAMQKSTELPDLVDILYHEINKLGFLDENTDVELCLLDEDLNIMTSWTSKDNYSSPNSQKSIVNLDEVPLLNRQFEEWRALEPQQRVYLDKGFEGGEKEWQQMLQYFSTHPDWDSAIKIFIENNIKKWYWHHAYNHYGSITINSSRPINEENIPLLRRFSSVFEQSYTRFLDLKRAEAQAREAQIEAALERIRSKSIAMRRSEDLSGLSTELVKQVKKLGIDTWFCAFNIYDKESSLEWGSNGENVFPQYRTPRKGVFLKYYEMGQNGETLFINEIDEVECPAHYDYLCSLPGVGDQLLKMKENGIEFPTSQIDHVAFFKYGYIIFITYDSVPEAHYIFKRFAKVFEQSYTRFLDLQKAERDFIEIKAAKQTAEEAFEELKATQAQLIQQEKLASLGQLTAGIAHEIKNPLNFVTNFSELSAELIEEIDEEMQKEADTIDFEMILETLEDIKTNLDKILHHGKRADGIVKSMLQHSRGGNGQLELVKINPIIKEYVNLAFHGMRAGKVPINVALNFNLDETIEEVPLIVEDFSRVILNLCNNAFDAMRDLSLNQNGFHPELTVSTIDKREKILIEISDNGPGISDDLKEKILQPFFTTKKGTEGTGLGLSITNDIIKAHRGTFEIDSKPEQGATFKILLPY